LPILRICLQVGHEAQDNFLTVVTVLLEEGDNDQNLALLLEWLCLYDLVNHDRMSPFLKATALKLMEDHWKEELLTGRRTTKQLVATHYPSTYSVIFGDDTCRL
jgi:hypothetical protein